MLPRDPSSYNLLSFYEPGAPSPALPILIVQTEIRKLPSPHHLLAQQQLVSQPLCTPTTLLTPNLKLVSTSLRPSQKTFQLRRRSRTPASKSELSTNALSAASQKDIQISQKSWMPSSPELPAIQSLALSAQRGVRISQKFLTPNPQDDLPANLSAEFDKELEPSGSDAESAGECEELIPKPEGEADRPGRGGYNLQEVLGLSDASYKKLKTFVKKAIEEELDLSKNYTSQSPQALDVIRTLATGEFPFLGDYAECWPVTDLIRLQLKYSSGRARQQQTKALATVAKRTHARK